MGNSSLKYYIIKRIFLSIPTFLVLTIITFSLAHLAPGGPLKYFMLNPESDVSMESYYIMVQRYGLDKPLWIQYLTWLKNLFLGDFGRSFRNFEPVSSLIMDRIMPTLVLTSTALFLSLVIGIPTGIICAIKRNGIIDFVIRIFTLIGISMPSFWEALLLIFFFSNYLKMFPVTGWKTISMTPKRGLEDVRDIIWHIFLPAITLATGNIVLISRLVRSTMLDILRNDYIMTARAKGLRERIVIFKHAFRNALLPIITVIGTRISFLLAGSVIVETVFAWPGLGKLENEAIIARDYPMIMAITTLIGIMVILSNLIIDIIYALIDPKIKY